MFLGFKVRRKDGKQHRSRSIVENTRVPAWRVVQQHMRRLGVSRKRTRWDKVLFVLVAYRLVAPGSEWRLHREWFLRSVVTDLLGEDAGLAEIRKLYRCHDQTADLQAGVVRSLGGVAARSLQHQLRRAAL
jgi:hypothetical protein